MCNEVVKAEKVSNETISFARLVRDRLDQGVKLYPWPGYLDRLDRLGLDTRALRAEKWGMP